MNSGGLTTPSLPPAPEDPPPWAAPLPRPFLHSLRILFEILDDQRKGAVHISEIESRWGRGGSGVAPQGEQEIPAGVLRALRQVAEPCGGFLSFPRLVAGLRIALSQAEEDAEAAEGGRGAAPALRSLSRTRCPGTVSEPGEKDYYCTRTAQDDLRLPPSWAGDTMKAMSWGDVGKKTLPGHTWAAGESNGKGVTRSRSTNSFLSQTGQCRIIPKEPRRHTISSAVEYEMLKQMQQLERERDALLQGLEMVNQVRDWLQRHLLEAQKRQKHMGAQANNYQDSYSKQSCLLLAKIQEVNLCLKSLLTSSGKSEVPLKSCGIPFSSPGDPFHQQAIIVLKEQNHLLTKEVSQKCQRIAQLEEEKASLWKQLKKSWGCGLPGHKEFTFI